MRLARLLSLCLAAATGVAGLSTAIAQAPDCTGISDVSSFDGAAVSDFDGFLRTVRVASGLLKPLLVTSPPGDVDRLFIVEQDGMIKILEGCAVLPQPFLDINALVRSPADGGGNEEGLLGLAFHPDYAANGWVFVYHTNTTGSQNVVARYTRMALNPDRADPASRVQVIAFDHPGATNHNGGMIAFGPNDGKLYIGTGDGGGGCDPSGNSQDLQSDKGKLLRIDVDTLPYSTTGNPWDGSATGLDEIWSYGLRNPWRFSFDRETAALYIGDVGQDEWEEIDCQPHSSTGRENYGWDHYEGAHCPNPSCGSQGSCLLSDHVPPVREFDQTTDGFSCSVTGGYVYRGCRMGDLHGAYFYADYCSSQIRTFTTDGLCNVSAQPDLLRTSDLVPDGGSSIAQITSFGEDARGEIYVVDRGGEVFKIMPILGIVEVSGQNATPLLMDSGSFTWEDLEADCAQSISRYKVYRSDNDPTGPFLCVRRGGNPTWVGGDPDTPLPGETFFYLVTATNAAGEETRPGNRSDGTPRSVDTGSSCS
jgi:glucose/arabinose dehydrogenase